MAYIFRLHNGTNTNQDWSVTNDTYGNNVIEAIQDPDGGNATKQITSIPSPFARIDLIKSAFKELEQLGIDGETIYHKMVSDALDVAEIFFNYEKFRDKFEIIAWNLTDLDKLKPEHGDVVDSLKIFYNQDSATYHFDRLGNLYILRYKGIYAKTNLDVVGATSPSTLFFTPANDLSYISPDINLGGQDNPFDGCYQSLYKRDFEFVKYLYLFRIDYNANVGSFASDFPEVNTYLDNVRTKLSDDKRSIINSLSINELQNYKKLQYNNNDITILGCTWRCKTLPTIIRSDFEIACAGKYKDKLPLVLPVKPGTTYGNYYYVQGPFGSDNAAPYSDEEDDLNKRILPHDGTPYPYLTIGDFLEDTMYIYDGKANEENYYFGEWNKENEVVLLPFKPRFFDFFTIDQLINGINGTKLLEIKDEETNIRVKLSIPIKGKDGGTDFMTYEKNYFSSKTEGDDTRGLKVKLDDSFGFSMMPLVKFHVSKPYYRIGLINGQYDTKEYSLEFYSIDNSLLDNNDPIRRNISDKKYSKLSIYCMNTNIDYIHVRVGKSGGGIIVPKMREESADVDYNFAIDFGTTNTHIEYTTSKQRNPEAFDITENDIQLNHWARYEDCNIEAYSMFESELLPQNIGTNKEFHFPTRTALSVCNSINWDAPNIMADNNFSFTYSYRLKRDFDQILTDLKWGNDDRQIKASIGNLMFLMRNKVLLNNGNLVNTKIVWFYPTSMTPHKRNLFKKLWKESYKDYFGDNIGNVSEITEALAPYIYYKGEDQATTRMVNIDIGGGTTDVIFAVNDEVKGSTSFRFAANSIFGTGYIKNGSLNGLIKENLKFFDTKFKDNQLDDCIKIHESLKSEKASTNIASFYFSLIDNKGIKEKGLVDALNWNKKLEDDEYYKIIFIFFYSAIMYHVAKIMKMKSFDMPRHISFSGNGSKVVSIISEDAEILADYTKKMFAFIYGVDYHRDGLTVILKNDPKVATCKGGLSYLNNANNIQKTNIGEKIVLLTDKFVTDDNTYKYLDYDKEKEKTILDIEQLLDFIKKNSRFLTDNFGVNTNILKTITDDWKQDVETFFDKGFEQKMVEINGEKETPIEESLFFYPIIGMLYRISTQIYEYKNNSN